MRSLLGGLAAVTMLAACFAPPAAAQTPTREKPFPELRDARRWGPFLVDPGFVVDNLGYDDNVYLASDASGRPKETDFVLRAGPNVEAQLAIGRRMRLTIHDRLRGEVFLKHSDLNHADNELEAQYDLLLGPVLLTTEGTWVTVRQRPWAELIERIRETRVGARQSARLFIGPFTDVVLRAGRTTHRYNDPGFDYFIDPSGSGEPIGVSVSTALNRRQTDVSAEVGWRPRARTRVFLRVTERTSRFDSPELGRDTRDLRRQVGIEFHPDSRLSGRLILGRSKLENRDRTFSYAPYEGSIGEALVAYRPTGSTRITLRGERQLYFSLVGRNLYYVDTFRGASIDSYLGSNWGVQAGVSRRDADYPEAGTFGPLLGIKRHDETNDVYVGVLFRMRGGFEIGFRAGRRERDSNDPSVVDEQRYFTTTGSYAF